MSSMALRIRLARTQAKLTQTELARRLAVQRSAITQWERENGGTCPSVRHLVQVACETNVLFEWMATGRGPRRADGDAMVDAVITNEFARDETELRALLALRRLARRKRDPMVNLIELFSG